MLDKFFLQTIKHILITACVKTFAVLFLLNILSIDFSFINLNINIFSVLCIVLIYEVFSFKTSSVQIAFFQQIMTDIIYRQYQRQLELDRLIAQHQQKISERS